jgi:prefoldin subunit 5
MDACRNDLGTEDDLFKHRNKSNKNIDYNNRQVVIDEGHRAQKESEEALKRIERNVVDLDKRADDVLTELDRQIKKLDEVYDELSDS